jgi:hypothetical protein
MTSKEMSTAAGSPLEPELEELWLLDVPRLLDELRLLEELEEEPRLLEEL